MATAVEFAAKRGDLCLIHRRLDSIAHYYQPYKVVSVTREGKVKEVEELSALPRTSEDVILRKPIGELLRERRPLDHILRVHEQLYLVSQERINVDAAMNAWATRLHFTDLDTLEKAQNFLRGFLS